MEKATASLAAGQKCYSKMKNIFLEFFLATLAGVAVKSRQRVETSLRPSELSSFVGFVACHGVWFVKVSIRTIAKMAEGKMVTLPPSRIPFRADFPFARYLYWPGFPGSSLAGWFRVPPIPEK